MIRRWFSSALLASVTIAASSAAQVEQGVVAPRVLWHFAEPGSWEAPAVVDGRVWHSARHLSCLDAASGEVVGRFDGRDDGFWRGTPAVRGEHVLAVHSSGTAYGLSRDLAAVRWSRACAASEAGVLVPAPGSTAGDAARFNSPRVWRA